MKKHSIWTKVLALLIAVLMMSTVVAFAEGDAPAEEPVQQEAPKAEAPKAEAPKAEAPKAEEPKAEAPKAEEPKAEEPKAEEPKAEEPKAEEPKAEEPKAEEPKAEEPAQETVVETPAEPVEVETAEPAEEPEQPEEEIVEIEDNETPLGIAPDGSAPVRFTGSVRVERKGSGEIFFGDRVTLVARVNGANTAYDIRWEVNRQDGAGWKTISGERGAEYDFTITPENVNYEYRVVLVTAA